MINISNRHISFVSSILSVCMSIMEGKCPLFLKTKNLCRIFAPSY